jgi:hypothetical protein
MRSRLSNLTCSPNALLGRPHTWISRGMGAITSCRTAVLSGHVEQCR